MGTIDNLNAALQKELMIIQTCDSDFSGMHSHPFFEFVYVLNGKAEHTINDHTMIISEGDYFIIDLNCSHGYRKLLDENDFCIVNCMFIPKFIDASLKGAKRFEELASFCISDFVKRGGSTVALSSYHDQDGFVGALIKRMMRESKEKKTGYAEMLRASLVNLIVGLARNETFDEGDKKEYVTRRVRAYADEHFFEQLHLGDICCELNFSLTYVSLTFKREMGMTFRDYLKKVRLERACGYLRTTDMTVAEISALVGYSDPAFLHKIFKKEMGFTPYEYRRMQGK